jgi:hypothetical protein
MNRQVIDGMIIAAVLALGATHLYAQNAGSRRVLRPNEAARMTGNAMYEMRGSNGAAAATGGRGAMIQGPNDARAGRSGTSQRQSDQHRNSGTQLAASTSGAIIQSAAR